MRLRTQNENIFSTYGLIAIPLIALTTFVVGYTASRAHLSQNQGQDATTDDYNFVIPHQAVLWSDFGG
ncbi:MAG: hypothetical protein AAF298_04915 [Cyanobacteria bacterium P01_A01_bin.40]